MIELGTVRDLRERISGLPDCAKIMLVANYDHDIVDCTESHVETAGYRELCSGDTVIALHIDVVLIPPDDESDF